MSIKKYKGTILIVDDVVSNLQVLFSYLEDVGFEVLVAEDGERALEIAELARPDLILLDILMPGMDGFETCRQLKTKPSTEDIPVIFTTALSETINKVKGFDLGGVDYITKPFEQEEVLVRIRTHLTLQSLRQRLVVQNQKLKQQTQQERLLFKLSDRIRQSLDIDSILKTAAGEVRQILNCDRVLIIRPTDAHSQIQVESIASGIESIASNIIDDYCSATGECQIGNIHIVEDIHKANLEPKYLQYLNRFGVRSTLAIPIWVNTNKSVSPSQNTLWGFLIAHQCSSSRQWQNKEINLLKRLTTQLAIAIAQGSLYQELERANFELKQLALCDPLTKVFNRRYFQEQLAQEWRRMQRDRQVLSLIMCDVDCFKPYNDTYGHQAGDNCLQQVATAISSAAKRGADFVARYGGEEFVVVLPQTSVEGASKVAEEIRVKVKALQLEHSRSSVSNVVTLSLGVASIVPTPEYSPSFLIENADRALYLAKRGGRDRVEVYNSEHVPRQLKETVTS